MTGRKTRLAKGFVWLFFVTTPVAFVLLFLLFDKMGPWFFGLFILSVVGLLLALPTYLHYAELDRHRGQSASFTKASRPHKGRARHTAKSDAHHRILRRAY